MGVIKSTSTNYIEARAYRAAEAGRSPGFITSMVLQYNAPINVLPHLPPHWQKVGI